jgi:hypothetical protein
MMSSEGVEHMVLICDQECCLPCLHSEHQAGAQQSKISSFGATITCMILGPLRCSWRITFSRLGALPADGVKSGINSPA